MLSMSEHREISVIVNDMPNDYNVLKSELEDFAKVADNLSKALETQQTYIRLIKAKMGEMDKNSRLDQEHEYDLRNYLARMPTTEYHDVKFYTSMERFLDGSAYNDDAILKIFGKCEHETSIASPLTHTFDICCEIMGLPHSKDLYESGEMISASWNLRAK